MSSLDKLNKNYTINYILFLPDNYFLFQWGNMKNLFKFIFLITLFNNINSANMDTDNLNPDNFGHEVRPDVNFSPIFGGTLEDDKQEVRERNRLLADKLNKRKVEEMFEDEDGKAELEMRILQGQLVDSYSRTLQIQANTSQILNQIDQSRAAAMEVSPVAMGTDVSDDRKVKSDLLKIIKEKMKQFDDSFEQLQQWPASKNYLNKIDQLGNLYCEVYDSIIHLLIFAIRKDSVLPCGINFDDLPQYFKERYKEHYLKFEKIKKKMTSIDDGLTEKIYADMIRKKFPIIIA